LGHRIAHIDPVHLATGQRWAASFFHGSILRNVSMSDISTGAVSVAADNAALLTPNSLCLRLSKLNAHVALYDRPRQWPALFCGGQLFTPCRLLSPNAFKADVTDPALVASQLALLPRVIL